MINLMWGVSHPDGELIAMFMKQDEAIASAEILGNTYFRSDVEDLIVSEVLLDAPDEVISTMRMIVNG